MKKTKALAHWAEDIKQNSQDINNILTEGAVKPHVQTHWTDVESGRHGLAGLIVQILGASGAVFPAGIESTGLRSVAIGGAMFTAEIEGAVWRHFSIGSTRYPRQSIRNYLSTYMAGAGIVGKIQLTNSEDKGRPCCKPRAKWYLIVSDEA